MKKIIKTFHQTLVVIPGNGSTSGTGTISLQSASDVVDGLCVVPVTGSADVLFTLEDNSGTKVFDTTDAKIFDPTKSNWMPSDHGMYPVDLAANSNNAKVTLVKPDASAFGANDKYLITFRSRKYAHD